METFFSILVLAVIILALTNELFQQKMGVSPMPTMPKVKRAMIELIPSGTSGTIMELGSGWGGIAFAAARAHPQCQVVGIEYSPFPYLMARLRKILSPGVANLQFMRKNFFDVPFRETTVVLCYLCNPLMSKLAKKFRNELPSGAWIISSTFFIPDWPPEKIKDITGFWSTRIFVYKKSAEMAHV